MERNMVEATPVSIKPLVVFINRNQMQFFGGSLPQIATLSIPPTVLKDLDLVNVTEFETFLQTFLTENKVIPSRVAFVLDESICFARDFSAIPDSQKDETIQKFVDTVPFDEIVVKTYKLASGFRVIAANRNFCEVLKKNFTAKGFTVVGILPVGALGITMHTLDVTAQNYFLSNFELYKEQSMISEEIIIEKKEVKKSGGSLNKRTIILLVVFLYLLLMMLVMLWMQASQQSTPKKEGNLEQPSVVEAKGADIENPTITEQPKESSPSGDFQTTPEANKQITP